MITKEQIDLIKAHVAKLVESAKCGEAQISFKVQSDGHVEWVARCGEVLVSQFGWGYDIQTACDLAVARWNNTKSERLTKLESELAALKGA